MSAPSTTRLLREASLRSEALPLRVAEPPPPPGYTTARAAEEAAEAAYRRGYTDGVLAGSAAATEDLDRAAHAVADAVTSAAAEVRGALRDHVDAIVDLAVAAAAQILGREPHDGGAALAERVVAAIDELDDARLVVAVHPDDRPAVADVVRGADVEVTTDEGLAPGEARIVGGWGRVELTRAAAWDAIREVLDASAG